MHFSMKRSVRTKGYITVASVLLLLFLVFVIHRTDNIFDSVSQSYASNTAVYVINTAVYDTIESDPRYKSFITVIQSNNDRITAAETNTALMNSFKAEVTRKIQKSLESDSSKTVYIPIGSIFGLHFFNNRGISIPVKLSPVSNIKTDFSDEFENNGINNIKHSVYINVEIELAVISYMSTKTQTVTTSIPVSETIIAGDVPIYFSTNGYMSDVPDIDVNTHAE